MEGIERELWQILVDESKNRGTVPITELGVQKLPTHKKQLKDIVLKWENQGLVVAFGGTKAMMTEKGRNYESN